MWSSTGSPARVTLAAVLGWVALAFQATAVEPAREEAVMTREGEIAEALAAGPPAVAEGAGVLILGPQGYEPARESRNGFHCLVGRSVPGSFEPMCFDAEGSETLMQAVLLEASLQAQGMAPDEVERHVAMAWAQGRLRAPRRAGINYMLSPRNRVPVDAQGSVRPYRPHVMIYAPYLHDRDLGSGEGSPVFMINPGEPGAYLIVPVADASLPGKGAGSD